MTSKIILKSLCKLLESAGGRIRNMCDYSKISRICLFSKSHKPFGTRLGESVRDHGALCVSVEGALDAHFRQTTLVRGLQQHLSAI
jgi:hypothetical protein